MHETLFFVYPHAGPPSMPAGVYVKTESVTQNSIMVMWTVGADNGGAVVAFIVEAENEFHPNDWQPVLSESRSWTKARENKSNCGKKYCSFISSGFLHYQRWVKYRNTPKHTSTSLKRRNQVYVYTYSDRYQPPQLHRTQI